MSLPCLDAAQRSAHELPLVEKQDMDGCSVLGGQQMILTGQNFSSDSRVIFMEKTQGERQLKGSPSPLKLRLFSTVFYPPLFREILPLVIPLQLL